jgi:hypothetical protein
MPLGAFKAALMGTAGVSTADVVLLGTATASGSASLAFTSGIDSTYGEYIFRFYNIHPASDGGDGFKFQVSIDGGSNYNVACTSSYFRTYHDEADSETSLGYNTSNDQAQGTSYQVLEGNIGNANDENAAGELHLFNPSSTTYVKHFNSRVNTYQSNDYFSNAFAAGYFNTTSAVNAISFKMGTGNIDAGKIKMWGVK